MNFKIRVEIQAEGTEAELWIDIYRESIVFTDSNGIEYKMNRADADVLIALLQKNMTE